MLAVDTNILVYAHRREARSGEEAYAVLAELAEGDRLWAIPWPCCYEFLSVVTNRRIWQDRASTPEQAWRQFRAWAESPSNRLLAETEGFVDILGRFVDRPPDRRGSGPRRPDRGHLRRPRRGGTTHPGP